MSDTTEAGRRFDALIMAGDKRAYRAVQGGNKALLEVEGAPLLAHVISALQKSRQVSRIFVVGPRERLAEALARGGGCGRGPKEVILVEQGETLVENAWVGFLATLPEGLAEGGSAAGRELKERFSDKAVLVLGADMPLLTPAEVDEFIEGCDLERYDYLLGMTPEESLRPYYPAPGTPGIRFAYFHFRDSRERQNNLHLIRVFRVINRDIIQKMYQYRYQKQVRNVLRLFSILLRTRAVTVAVLFKFLLLHLCRVLDRPPWSRLQGWFRRFLVREKIEKDLSRVLRARLAAVRTTYGGAALDVDNEEHLEIIRARFREWKAYQEQLRERRAQGRPAGKADPAGEGAALGDPEPLPPCRPHEGSP